MMNARGGVSRREVRSSPFIYQTRTQNMEHFQDSDSAASQSLT